MKALLNLFYPDLCPACTGILSQGERFICTPCRHDLPLTGFHELQQSPIHKLLMGRVPLEQAAALFYFEKKSKVQNLIHNLKYRNQEKISGQLGKWMGEELRHSDRFNDIDGVMPVPLHRLRKHKRGYNQVDGFALEIAKALNTTVVKDVLYHKKSTSTQVFLKRESRSTSVLKSFAVRQPNTLCGKHILLVDDLITTGGTVEGCYLALKQIEGLKISVAFMAMATG